MVEPIFESQSSSAQIQPGADARSILKTASAMLQAIAAIGGLLETRHRETAFALGYLRDSLVSQRLYQIETKSLREFVDGSVRLGKIAARYPTVGHLTRVNVAHLEAISGVGNTSASKVIAAVGTAERTIREHTPIKLSTDNRSQGYTNLVVAAFRLLESRRMAEPLLERCSPLLPRLTALAHTARPMSSPLRMFFRSSHKREIASRAADELSTLLAFQAPTLGELRGLPSVLAEFVPRPDEAWAAFGENPIQFNDLIIKLGAPLASIGASEGYVPAEIARRVNAQSLDGSLLKATLRGYQAFGARFALTQRRTILGDEMGLGKTIEALAVACHLASHGTAHVLVVAPASVLVNWLHETAKHTHLASFRLHGPSIDVEQQMWIEDGGLAVTTYGMLGRLQLPPDFKISLLVVDEAHYVKNPNAKRTKSVIKVGKYADYVLYMTGTPMENRVDEFAILISQLQPEVLNRINPSEFWVVPEKFRSFVAPVYLRRNQEDVLSELPERVDVTEWLEFGSKDGVAYRNAVASGNFMAMRQAAFAPGTVNGSTKLARLIELVEQVTDQGRKVIVFSYFRSVLAAIAAALGDTALEPITGDVSPERRQQIVDDFTNRTSPVVLVAQIIAGGVGLNIQAASVVILAEPQVKPSMEEQAIARSHRMGQTRTVYVHRLLVEDSVDKRMLEILARKQKLFDDYAVGSTLKDAADAAIDPTGIEEEALSITRDLELEIIRMERQRLGLSESEIMEPS